jgi:hypothetical protein
MTAPPPSSASAAAAYGSWRHPALQQLAHAAVEDLYAPLRWRAASAGPVPGMAGQVRPELETACVLPMTQVNGTNELMAQIHDA